MCMRKLYVNSLHLETAKVGEPMQFIGVARFLRTPDLSFIPVESLEGEGEWPLAF